SAAAVEIDAERPRVVMLGRRGLEQALLGRPADGIGRGLRRRLAGPAGRRRCAGSSRWWRARIADGRRRVTRRGAASRGLQVDALRLRGLLDLVDQLVGLGLELVVGAVLVDRVARGERLAELAFLIARRAEVEEVLRLG